MPDIDPSPHSQLFTLRIWPETLEGDQKVWRGRIQHIPSNDIRHFQGWEMLIQELIGLIDQTDPSE